MPVHFCRPVALLLGLVLVPLASAGDSRDLQSLIAQGLPRVVHLGGPFLRSPAITTVTFAGDDPRIVERLEAFGELIVRTAWWREVASGYCVGANDCIGVGRAGRRVRLERRLSARVRDVDIEALLEKEVRAGVFSDLGANPLVLVYLPSGVVLRDAFNPHYCAGGPRAFHRMLHSGQVSFPFAVIPRCGHEAETTATASHEILEATTNPDPNVPGFRIAPGTPAFTAAAEPVDPCGLLNRDQGALHSEPALLSPVLGRTGQPRQAPTRACRPYPLVLTLRSSHARQPCGFRPRAPRRRSSSMPHPIARSRAGQFRQST